MRTEPARAGKWSKSSSNIMLRPFLSIFRRHLAAADHSRTGLVGRYESSGAVSTDLFGNMKICAGLRAWLRRTLICTFRLGTDPPYFAHADRLGHSVPNAGPNIASDFCEGFGDGTKPGRGVLGGPEARLLSRKSVVRNPKSEQTEQEMSA